MPTGAQIIPQNQVISVMGNTAWLGLRKANGKEKPRVKRFQETWPSSGPIVGKHPAFRATDYNSRLTKRLSFNSTGAITNTGSVSREIDRCRQTA